MSLPGSDLLRSAEHAGLMFSLLPKYLTQTSGVRTSRLEIRLSATVYLGDCKSYTELGLTLCQCLSIIIRVVDDSNFVLQVEINRTRVWERKVDCVTV